MNIPIILDSNKLLTIILKSYRAGMTDLSYNILLYGENVSKKLYNTQLKKFLFNLLIEEDMDNDLIKDIKKIYKLIEEKQNKQEK